jgi:hypothetical protein
MLKVRFCRLTLVRKRESCIVKTPNRRVNEQTAVSVPTSGITGFMAR